MENGSLQNPLKPEGRLCFSVIPSGQCGNVLIQVGPKLLLKLAKLGTTGAQDFGRRRIIDQRHEEMLNGHKLMALLACLSKRRVQCDFEFLAQHS